MEILHNSIYSKLTKAIVVTSSCVIAVCTDRDVDCRNTKSSTILMLIKKTLGLLENVQIEVLKCNSDKRAAGCSSTPRVGKI